MAIVKKLFLFVLLLIASAESAYADKQADFLKNLQDRAQSIYAISSEFSQQSHVSLFADTMNSRGNFYFARPDNLRWEYTEPFVSGFLLNGHQGLKWDAATEEPTPVNTATSPEMTIISEQILAWTTMDITWLQSLYSIKVTDYSPAAMELTPKSDKTRQFINLIRIFFAPGADHLKGIEMHSPDGDYTKIIFSNVQLNKELPQDIFLKQ
ncbi:LolA family protein [Maridesulfovibrio sp. FT414]|uniref:LolA family protein n=1 Tax=Maridesulfovibrio sp. FT414 TaxID=2979469 RepID=UPI003D8075F9